MSARLPGKVAIVTGAARGIGAAIAQRFAAEGAHVIGADREADAVVEGVDLRPVDITDVEAVQHLVDAVRERYGHIDVLVNNAGRNVFRDPLTLSEEDWTHCLAVDLKGAWNLCKAVLPGMLEQGAGSIVNIASVHGHKVLADTFPYPIAKHGLIGMTKALGIQYAARGIRVNSISPGLILTPQIEAWFATQPDPEGERRRQTEILPCKRIGSPQEVAAAALFLASDEASFINATDLLVDGGRSQLYHD